MWRWGGLLQLYPKDTGLLLEELKGKEVDPAILQPEYGRMFSKNDYLMEIK